MANASNDPNKQGPFLSRFVNEDGTVNERDLITACRNGDHAAVDFLVLYCAEQIHDGVADAWARTKPYWYESDELQNDVVAKIIESPRTRLTCRTDEVRDLHNWIFIISRNLALKTLESLKVSRRPAVVANDPKPADEACDPGDASEEANEVLEQARADLSDWSRAVFDLHQGWGTSKPRKPKEIARMLGMTLRQVYYKLKLIKQRILNIIFRENSWTSSGKQNRHS